MSGPSRRFRWAVRATGAERGNALGYATANERLRLALAEAGWRESDEPGADAVHFCFPKLFDPSPRDRRSILFTMYENPDDEQAREEVFLPAFERADLVLAPSRWCRDLFVGWGCRAPVEVVPLGVDLDAFPFRPRSWNPRGGQPFVWIYNGAPNGRKFTVLLDVWPALVREGLERMCHLYFKTTGLPAVLARGFAPSAARHLSTAEGDLLEWPGVTIDARKLPVAALARLYHRAHGALFLHCGEGWGLTGLEAMATGCPLVVSDYSGTQEYATAENAYLVQVSRRRLKLLPDPQRPELPAEWEGPWPEAGAAMERMADVMCDYPAALRRARLGARRARELSWAAAGRRLSEALAAG